MLKNARQVASTIEHTLLKPEAATSEIDRLCDEALEHGFRAVCVNPRFVRRAVQRLGAAYPSVGVVSVAGFPLGATHSETKADEARRALADGATGIDMVMAVGALREGDRAYVRKDIESVARVVHGEFDAVLKVILECAALSDDRIILGCRMCAEAEADFVKTATGFLPAGGAAVEHVRLLHRHASPMLVKASGGIRTWGQARALLEAGSDVLGTSSSVAILREIKAQAG